ncbi:MAG: Maf family protein [Acidiferrobacterales bacterium]
MDMPDPDIYLASSSPRRQELLRQFGIAFETQVPEINEQPRADEPAADYVLRVAAEKARCVANRVGSHSGRALPVLGADTEVIVDREIFGKPRTREHGCEMLRRLSGRTHQVLTALCVVHQGVERSALSESRVTFGPLSEEEIARYWDSGEPADKAGAYAIQGRAAAFVARLEGSYSGVMGLPLYELAMLLRDLGMPIL